MAVNRRLFCTGDPVLDIYAFGKAEDRLLKTDKLERCHGGALNVWKNLESILGRESVNYFSPLKSTSPILLLDTINLYTVYRFIDENSNLIVEGAITPQANKSTFYKRKLKEGLLIRFKVFVEEHSNQGDRRGLVISEYNKGAYNGKNIFDDGVARLPKGTNFEMPKFDFCVIDSRYRSINLNLISSSKIKIWHATNLEYDEEFAKNFHYIFHTDGPNKVRIYTGDGKEIGKDDARLEVPNTKIVNTCGAGDTFTAASASYLLNQDKIREETLIEAAKFAIKCCQDVITTRCTTATRVSLE